MSVYKFSPAIRTSLAAVAGITGSVAAAVGATSFALTGPTTGVTGTPSTFTVTPNAALGSTTVVTISAPGATATPTTLTFAAGSSAAQTFTVNRATDGTTSVSISSALASTGSPISYSTTSVVPTGTPGQLGLRAAVTGTVPFAVGHSFRRGDVPVGYGLAVTGATAQVTPKNYWPDGSLKFAILAGTFTSASAGTEVMVSMAAGTSSSGTALTTTDLKAVMTQAVSIGCGGFGTATWSGTDWDAPFDTWVSGHLMSSWTYRKPVGSDAHLVAWLEVRLWSTGAVEVLPWIENGYLNVSGPTNKSATYTFTMGGTTRYSGALDLAHHTRTPLITGTGVAHWLGTDPDVIPRHDADYMANTGLVPGYIAAVKSASFPAAPATNGFATSFTPLEQGDQSPSMGQSGPHASIGLIANWDAAYLCSTTDPTNGYRAMVFNTYRHGRYSVHYRDETTNRPLRFASYPNLGMANTQGKFFDAYPAYGSVFTPAESGTLAQQYKVSHHPSAGYLAYLVTGRRYMLDELQLTATAQFLARGAIRALPDTTHGEYGLIRVYAPINNGAQVLSAQIREAGWSVRTLFQCTSATPDADPLRADLVESCSRNAEHQWGIFLGKPNHPFGMPVTTGTNNNWAQFFETDFWVTGWLQGALCDVVPAGTFRDKLREYVAYTARAVVKRLGGTRANEFHFADAQGYRSQYISTKGPVFCPTTNADGSGDVYGGTGPFHVNWGKVYEQTMGFANPGTGNSLQPVGSGYITDPGGGWGAVHMAVSLAVTLGIAEADEGYARLTGADNYSLYTGSCVSSVYVNMACAPATVPGVRYIPAWLAAIPIGEWGRMPNSKFNGDAAMQLPDGDWVIGSFCGSFTNKRGIYVGATFIPGTFQIFWGVGHNPNPQGGYTDIYAYGPLEGDAPQIRRIRDRTSPSPENVEEDANGNPVARHTYASIVYTGETRNQLLVLGGLYRYSNAGVDTQIRKFSFNTPSPNSNMPWSKTVAVPGGIPAYAAVFDDAEDKAFYHPATSAASNVVVYDMATDTTSVGTGKNYGIGDDRFGVSLDSKRGIFCQFGSNYGGTSPASFYRTNNGISNDYYPPNQTGTIPSITGYCGALYDRKLDRHVVWQGGGKTLHVMTPPASNPYQGGSAYTWTTLTPATGVTPGAQSGAGTYGRFGYFEAGASGGYYLWNDRMDDGYFFRAW